MSEPIGIAVDGGNSKTHLALVRRDGTVLALVAGPGSSPHRIGLDGCLDVLGEMLGEAVREAQAGRGDGALPRSAGSYWPGRTCRPKRMRCRTRSPRGGWARRMKVANDTFGVLRAGSDRGWGVAVVCGAGVNCVGVAPDGRATRFPALGLITGDWGGGDDVGPAGLAAAARGADGRGQPTSLQSRSPPISGRDTPGARGGDPLRPDRADRLVEVAPIVLIEAESDAVAREIVDRLAAEIVAFARVALTRLELLDGPVEVVLGGGLIRSGRGGLVKAVVGELRQIAPLAEFRSVAAAPVVGAALLALDDLGADEAAKRGCARGWRRRNATGSNSGGGADV